MKSTRKRFKHDAHERGVAMMEALISVVLLAIGILGLIAFQTEMTKNSTQAKLRGEAAFLANQLIGQMWADDRTNFARYNVVAGNCQISGFRACENWAAAVRATLPASVANVGINLISGEVNITLRWTLPGEAENRYQLTAFVLN